MIGTGFPPGKGTLPGRLDAQAQQVKVLGETVIPKERLLGSGTDLYIDTFASMNMGGGMGDAPTEKEFEAAGIKHTFLKSTACAATSKSPVTDLSAVEDDITSLGAATGTSAKAKALVDEMKNKVDAVRKAVGGTPVGERPTYFFFDYDVGTKQPMAVCNRQIAHAVITLAGAWTSPPTTSTSVTRWNSSPCSGQGAVRPWCRCTTSTPSREVLRPALLAGVFGVRATVVDHPRTGDPLIAFDHRAPVDGPRDTGIPLSAPGSATGAGVGRSHR